MYLILGFLIQQNFKIPKFKSDVPEIKWSEMAEANNFKFARYLKIPKSFSKQLEMWQHFSGYKLNEHIDYKINFFSGFSNNNLESAKFTLEFFPLIQKECVAIIEEYVVPLVSKSESDLDDQLMPVIRKAIKAILWALGIIIGLNNAGFDVAALIAGLGIGGLALGIISTPLTAPRTPMPMSSFVVTLNDS